MTNFDLDVQIDALEHGVKLARAQAAEKEAGADQLEKEMFRLMRVKQKRCKHPKGFPGFTIGVCPDCDLDDGGY